MKFITIRHDKSENNEFLEKNPKEYLHLRKLDPDLFPEGKLRCEKLAQYFLQEGIKIDKFYCSLHLRAIKTMTYIADTYDKDKKIPRECFLNIYELGGNYQGKKGYPGLTQNEINQQFPELIIPENVDIKNGWYKNENKETDEEFILRVKNVIEELKLMAKNCEGNDKEGEGYTVCLITHVHFLNGLYSLLMKPDCVFTPKKKEGIHHDNLGISSFDIDKEGKVTINYINKNPLK